MTYQNFMLPFFLMQMKLKENDLLVRIKENGIELLSGSSPEQYLDTTDTDSLPKQVPYLMFIGCIENVKYKEKNEREGRLYKKKTVGRDIRADE